MITLQHTNGRYKVALHQDTHDTFNALQTRLAEHISTINEKLDQLKSEYDDHTYEINNTAEFAQNNMVEPYNTKVSELDEELEALVKNDATIAIMLEQRKVPITADNIKAFIKAINDLRSNFVELDEIESVDDTLYIDDVDDPTDHNGDGINSIIDFDFPDKEPTEIKATLDTSTIDWEAEATKWKTEAERWRSTCENLKQQLLGAFEEL